MARYYFHAADGTQFPDDRGDELPSLEAAKAAALNMMVEMLPSTSAKFWEDQKFSVTVKDEAGRIVAALVTTAIVDPVAQGDGPPEG